MEHFAEVFKGLKVNADKSKVMVLDEEGLECEIYVDETRFQILGCVMDESGTDVLSVIERYQV